MSGSRWVHYGPLEKRRLLKYCTSSWSIVSSSNAYFVQVTTVGFPLKAYLRNLQRWHLHGGRANYVSIDMCKVAPPRGSHQLRKYRYVQGGTSTGVAPITAIVSMDMCNTRWHLYGGRANYCHCKYGYVQVLRTLTPRTRYARALFYTLTRLAGGFHKLVLTWYGHLVSHITHMLRIVEKPWGLGCWVLTKARPSWSLAPQKVRHHHNEM